MATLHLRFIVELDEDVIATMAAHARRSPAAIVADIVEDLENRGHDAMRTRQAVLRVAAVSRKDG
jgi:hypothetical protein